MHASIRRYRVEPGSSAGVIQRVSQTFVPLLKEVDGFVAYYILKAEDGVITTISLFEDQNGADESDRLAAEWIKQNVAAILPALRGTFHGKVVSTNEWWSLEGEAAGLSDDQGLEEVKKVLRKEALTELPRGDEQDLRLLSVDEVCEVLGMSKSWVYRHIRSGDIPSVRLGGSTKVKRADLAEYLQKHRYLPQQDEEE
jgi:excisionase family DNA binding protein